MSDLDAIDAVKWRTFPWRCDRLVPNMVDIVDRILYIWIIVDVREATVHRQTSRPIAIITAQGVRLVQLD